MTVDGVAARILAPEAFVIEDDGRGILVLDAADVGGPAIDEGEDVVVTGRVVPVSAADIPSGIGDDLDLERLADTAIRAELVRERLAARG